MLLLPVVVYKTQSVAWSPLCAQEWSSSSVPPIYLHEIRVCMYKAGAHAPFPYLLFETLSRRRTQQHAMCPNIFRTSTEGSGGGGGGSGGDDDDYNSGAGAISIIADIYRPRAPAATVLCQNRIIPSTAPLCIFGVPNPTLGAIYLWRRGYLSCPPCSSNSGGRSTTRGVVVEILLTGM